MDFIGLIVTQPVWRSKVKVTLYKIYEWASYYAGYLVQNRALEAINNTTCLLYTTDYFPTGIKTGNLKIQSLL
jgi:hypothetical protein